MLARTTAAAGSAKGDRAAAADWMPLDPRPSGSWQQPDAAAAMADGRWVARIFRGPSSRQNHMAHIDARSHAVKSVPLRGVCATYGKTLL